MPLKVREIKPADQANTMEFTPVLHSMISNNMCIPQSVVLQLTNINIYESQELKPFTISYTVN